MSYSLYSFKQFIKQIYEKQTDPELMDKMEDEVIKSSGECPRCGKDESKCICVESDIYSTVTAYRAPKGVEAKMKK